ncbi:MAG: SH3 domain-containing protein [Clostridiales bacterium]|nr:SH3 domain-containing protein [Clostridiales bacterium]
MRKLTIFIAALVLMLGAAALAEESLLMQSSLFSVRLPAGLNPDMDEFSRADFPFLSHILHPVTIQGSNEDYSLLITLYDFPSKERHRVDNKENKPMGLFALIAEYNGLQDQMTPRLTRMDGDFRDFVAGSIPEKGYYLVTLYNPNRGEGYVFELRVKNNALTPADAEALLLSIATTLREAGIIYPEDTGMTLVVTHPGVNIRSAPDQHSSVLIVAKEGQTFPYLGENGIWYMIDVNGKVGYVSKALTMLQP